MPETVLNVHQELLIVMLENLQFVMLLSKVHQLEFVFALQELLPMLMLVPVSLAQLTVMSVHLLPNVLNVETD
jgi:hypothetical protein